MISLGASRLHNLCSPCSALALTILMLVLTGSSVALCSIPVRQPKRALPSMLHTQLAPPAQESMYSRPEFPKVAVVIPSYKVTKYITAVIQEIGTDVHAIYVVDDKCPEGSGHLVEQSVSDPRVVVLYHDVNQGVGGATLTGIRQAIADGMEIVVKIDGDGQMDPALVPRFVKSIKAGEADFAKGNRFFELEDMAEMPLVRIIGNAGLSFLSKLSTGYWHSFDPTNGYFAIHAKVAALLPFDKLSKRFFFETDLLFRLNTLQAKVVDVPMRAVYRDEVSNLRPDRELVRFGAGHIRNFGKRIFYNYFLRNFSIASVELILGLALLTFGVAFGLANWSTERVATAGTVMLAALPVIVGVQLLLAFINFDIQAVPRLSIHTRL